MKRDFHLRLKVGLMAAVFSVTLVFGSAQRAEAQANPGYAGVGIVGLYLTYLTGKTIVCTAVAAANARAHEEGFGGAFGDCWNGKFDSQQPTKDEQKPDQAENSSTITPED